MRPPFFLVPFCIVAAASHLILPVRLGGQCEARKILPPTRGTTAGLAPGIHWTFQLLPARLRERDVLHFRVVIRNSGNSMRRIDFAGSQRARLDVQVADSAGRVVWERIGNRPRELAAVGYALGPADSIAFTEDWNLLLENGHPLPHGCYTVTGILSPFSDAYPTVGPVTARALLLVVEMRR
jgi:hypothetical protein